jgi:hypothetical protein
MSRDLRQYNRQTLTRIVVGFLALVFVVGGSLIFLFYGRGAGFTGLLCILGGLLPVFLITLLLWIADRVVQSRK